MVPFSRVDPSRSFRALQVHEDGDGGFVLALPLIARSISLGRRWRCRRPAVAEIQAEHIGSGVRTARADASGVELAARGATILVKR